MIAFVSIAAALGMLCDGSLCDIYVLLEEA